MRIVLFVLPVIQTVIFGYAVNMDVRSVPTAVMDRDNSPESRDLLAMLFSSCHFRPKASPQDLPAAQMLLDNGDARLALVINPGFSAELLRGKQALIDGSDSNTAGIVLG